MALHRFDPLADLLNLQDRMNRLFEESLALGSADDPAAGAAGWVPLADAYETSEAFVVVLELAGLGEDDIEVHVDGERLTVRGERRPAGDARPECYYRMERSYGYFSRSFRFGEEVDPDRVTAQFRDGLLRLELPKVHSRGGHARGERAE